MLKIIASLRICQFFSFNYDDVMLLFYELKIELMDMAKQKAAEPAVSWAFLVSRFAVY